MHTLRISLSNHLLNKSKILEQFPDLDDDTLRDTLEGISSLPEMIAEVVRSALIDESLVEGLKSRLGEMKERQARLQERARKKRALAIEVMAEADLRKLTEPDFTVSLRKSPPSLIVVSEDDVPDAYWNPQPPKLDKQALLVALKSDQEISGVELSNSRPTISVRTK